VRTNRRTKERSIGGSGLGIRAQGSTNWRTEGSGLASGVQMRANKNEWGGSLEGVA
jgi:hypothetical protein